MRTTIDLDEDVLQSVKEIAAIRRTTAGKVLSELVRSALLPPQGKAKRRNGVLLLPRRKGARLVTMEEVNRLRDEL